MFTSWRLPRLRLRTSNCSLLLTCLPRKVERLSQPGWLTYSGRFTHINGHKSAARRAQDRERSPVRDPRTNYDCRVRLCAKVRHKFNTIAHNNNGRGVFKHSDDDDDDDDNAASTKYRRPTTCSVITSQMKVTRSKVKVWTLAIAPLTWVRLVTSSALQSRKWQLIGMSQWCRSALCCHIVPALTDNWTHDAASRHTITPNQPH